MEIATGAASVLPQLSIGVVSILVLGAAIYFFVRYLAKRDDQMASEHEAHLGQIESMVRAHAKQLDEREAYNRQREQEFRDTLSGQLAKNTEAMSNSSQTIIAAVKAMDRMIIHLENVTRKPRARKEA
jgi:biopolymer transport protein ExbB/TolQ